MVTLQISYLCSFISVVDFCVVSHSLQAIVANVGDAKAVLARSSTTSEGETILKSIVLTREHKAIFPQERARIQKVS
jgi:integrin-linked kinase-associated serine/threonine phosphatase 2C